MTTTNDTHEVARSHRPRGLLGAAAGVAGLMLLGNGLGFVRDMTVAALFGAGSHTDAFVVGWTIPETFSALLMEGLLPLVLVPWLVQRTGTKGELRAAVGTMAGPLLALGVVGGLLVTLLAPTIVRLVAPDIADPDLAVTCVRAAAFTVPALTIAGTLSALLRSLDRLVLPAAVYSAYNVGIITTTVLLHGKLDVVAAALGLSIGAALMCLIQLPTAIRLVGRFSFHRFGVGRAGSALMLAAPALVYLVVRQAQTFAERYYGSHLPGGAITHLNYTQKLGQFPVTIALSLALVSFPALSRYAAEGDSHAVRNLLAKVVRAIVVLLVPASVGVAIAAEPIVRIAFGRGQFDDVAVAATASTLSLYAFGLLAQALQVTAALALFAIVRNSWQPALWCLVCLVATVTIDAATVGSMGARGITLGNVVGITLAALGLCAVLARRGAFRPLDIIGTFARSAAAALIGGALAWFACGLGESAAVHLALSLLSFVVAFLVVHVASGGALVRDIVGARQSEPVVEEAPLTGQVDAAPTDATGVSLTSRSQRRGGRRRGYAGRHRH